MAIAFLEVKTEKRHKSKASSTSKASYRAGQKLTDAYGVNHDFTRRQCEIYSKIFVADNSSDRFNDRETLWNAVDEREKHPRARLAREFIGALPNELSKDEQIAIAEQFSMELASRYETAIDLAVHFAEGNIHCHCRMPTRKIKNGELTDKLRELDLSTKSGEHIESIRQLWQNCLDEYDVKVDMRSYRRQGIGKVPQLSMGHKVNALEKKGVRTRIGDINRNAKKINATVERKAKIFKDEFEKMNGSVKTLMECSGFVPENFSKNNILDPQPINKFKEERQQNRLRRRRGQTSANRHGLEKKASFTQQPLKSDPTQAMGKVVPATPTPENIPKETIENRLDGMWEVTGTKKDIEAALWHNRRLSNNRPKPPS